MKHLVKALYLIQKFAAKSDKIRVLEHERDNVEFTETLKWMLDPLIVSGISDKKLCKEIKNKTVGVSITSWMNLMKYLKTNNTGRDEDIMVVRNFLDTLSDEDRPCFELLVTKKLRIGVDLGIVNYVYGSKFLPTFKVMLAYPLERHEMAVDGKDFTITEKLDGFRLATIISDGDISFYSRQGKEIRELLEIKLELQKFCEMAGIDNIFFDGELVSVNCDKISSKDNYNIVVKTAKRNGEKRGLLYKIFDTLPYSEYKKHSCSKVYEERRKTLDEYSELMTEENGFSHISILPILYSGDDYSQIYVWHDWAKHQNKEGVMININDKKYEYKRTNALLKCKTMLDCDAKVVDIYEGDGDLKGTLGGIVIEFIYRDKFYSCKCGSGFTDKERKEYWKNPELILDKIVTIQYFEITKNDDGQYGLRFPVWIHRIRYDKTEISMN